MEACSIKRKRAVKLGASPPSPSDGGGVFPSKGGRRSEPGSRLQPKRASSCLSPSEKPSGPNGPLAHTRSPPLRGTKLLRRQDQLTKDDPLRQSDRSVGSGFHHDMNGHASQLHSSCAVGPSASIACGATRAIDPYQGSRPSGLQKPNVPSALTSDGHDTHCQVHQRN